MNMAPISVVVTLLALLVYTMAAPNGVSNESLTPRNEILASIGPKVILLKNETENGRKFTENPAMPSMSLRIKGKDDNDSAMSSAYIREELVTDSPVSTKFVISENMTALGNFKGEMTESFLKKINPHWLYFPPQSPTAHYILATIYFFMMMFGLTGNALVIFLFIKCSSVRTPANNLILNLAISDFLIMLEAPIFIYNALNFGPASGEFACKMYGMLGATGGTVAIITLTFISIDRYNVIVYPLNPSRSTTNMRSRLMILFVWVYSLPFCVIPFFEAFGVGGYIPEGFLTACSYDYLDTSPENYYFIFIYAIAAYFLPLFIIAYCYLHILHVVRSAQKIQSSKDNSKNEVKLAVIVMGIVGLWIFAWTPYCVVSLIGIFGYAKSITPLASMIPAIMAKMAACADPYLYAVTHPRFRSELEKMFCSGSSNFQTNFTSRASRRGGMESECETVQLDEPAQKKKFQRAESSICEESTVS